MKVAFAGTPEFARAALAQLLAAGFDVPLALTQPDRPAGRGLRLQPSPVKQLALACGIAVAQPRGLRMDGRWPADAVQARAALQAAQPDVMVVAAYGLLLPQWVLEFPRLGCLNIHASLLPRWRGAAPIHRAIEAGDAESGVTIMQMDAGLDTGDMLRMEKLPIAAQETTASLHDKLAALGAGMIVKVLKQLGQGPAPATPQPATGVSYARKIEKHEAAIDWRQPADAIERRIRAFDPFPGASAQWDGQRIKLWRAETAPALDQPRVPCGQILQVDDAGVAVACQGGCALRLTELQRIGGKRLPAREFLRGFALRAGQCFALPESATP
ncbi:MAG: methionyl-tRNA formyltransferase [Burkholderiaceae bacterium]|jgi:methionyl-tRNA formyltransferase|nr:methionyl-tRNA formyltransferase [Burkholderiaceae bacterium]